MYSPLFRREAIDHQRQRLLGEVLVAQPLSFALLTALLGLATLGILVFLVLGDYARKERVKGYLVPEGGLVKVYTPRVGTVAALHVEDGQVVRRNQDLISLSADSYLVSGDSLMQLLLNELADQRRNVEESLSYLQQKAELDRAHLTDRVAGLSQTLEHLAAQHGIQERRAQVAAEQLSATESLAAKGYAPTAELRNRKELHLLQVQEVAELAGEISKHENELEEARYALEEVEIRLKQEVSNLNDRLSDIAQREARLRTEEANVLRAPVAGRVTALQPAVGQKAEPDVPLLAILPEDDGLEAELLVPARAIAFLEPGQPVRLYYEAFPFQRFGTYGGAVVSVSRSILSPGEMPIPLALDEPVYPVRVRLDEQAVRAYGKRIALQSGMPLQADIILERRSLLDWLLEPLYTVAGRVS